MTGRRHLDWFARARGADVGYALELVERFQVVLDRPLRELSTGNRQKIGLVLAFMHHPELLILDEPTSGLDPLMQAEFEHLVREAIAEGCTVFLSSHELDEVQRLADRVALIKDGRLITTDTVEGLRRKAPQRVQARFPLPVDASMFAHLPGVSVTACEDSHIVLEVIGAIGPVLRMIAERDPTDVTARHADLDELFLDLYRHQPAEPSRGN
jgi:ABC-2 type transport system ATP-binding protein